MSLIATCYVHEYPRQGCPGCQSARAATYLAMIRTARKGTPTPDEQSKLEEVAERFEGPDGFIRAAGFTVKGTVGE
jgi:hypothetical protein